MMKRTVIAAIALLSGSTLLSQAFELHQLYRTYRGEEEVTSLYVPGFICRMAGNIADMDPPERELLRSIKSVRIQVIENREINREINFAREFSDMGFSDEYLPMLEVHDSDEDILILARQREDTIRDLVILVGGDENVLVWIKGRMDHDLLKNLCEVTGITHCRHTREI